MYQYAVHSAERICENSKVEAMTSLLKELSERDTELERSMSFAAAQGADTAGSSELSGGLAGGESSRVVATRKLRSKSKAEGGETEGSGSVGGAGGPTSAASASNSGGLEGGLGSLIPPPIGIALSEEEALADLRAVYRKWRLIAQKWRQTSAFSLMPTRVEKINGVSKLLYGKDVFVKGEPVAVFSELTRQEFYGNIFSLNPTEVVVKMGDNSRARVLLTHLRHGRLSLYHNLTAGEANAGSIGVNGARSTSTVDSGQFDWRDGAFPVGGKSAGVGGGGDILRKTSKKRSAAAAGVSEMGGSRGYKPAIGGGEGDFQ